jgi:putative transposase
MRPFGTSQQLARRRQRALDLLQQGQHLTEVAQRVGATPQSVCRWRRESLHPRAKPKRTPGRPARLSPAQLRRLVSVLKRGAYAQGYAEDYWTLDRIAHVVWVLFRVRYRASSLWYLLERLGWSCQQPQRRSLARDDQAIAHWKRYIWPQIKKVARTGRDSHFDR